MSLATPAKLRRLQRALYVAAKRDPVRRFHVLYDKVWREDILAHAYALSRENGGAPGVDGVTFAQTEAYGVDRWLGELREEVRTGRYTPQPVRRVMIPKSGGVGQRPLGIPTIRDRVVQTAAKLVIEPIFEADFDEAAYGYRPRRSAHDAVRTVHKALDDGRTEVVDADLSEVLRYDPARSADDVPRAPNQRRPDAASAQDVAEGAGRGGGRAGRSADEWREEGDAGNTAGRSGVATLGEHLHASVHQGVSPERSRPEVRRGAGHLRRRLGSPLSARGRRGPREDAALDGQHRARAERGQDRRAERPMRVLRFPGLHLRTDVLAANRRTLQRSTAFEEGRRRRQGGDPKAGCGPGTRRRGRRWSAA